MIERAKHLASIISKHDEILVVTHIDADGVTAGAIASAALERLGKEHSIKFVKQIDDDVLKEILDANPELVWFTDLGSNVEGKMNRIVTDHHRFNVKFYDFILNPHLFGLDGSIDTSGAGTTYLVAKALDKKNVDLSALAIVGACGDLQDYRYCKLVGTNRQILEDGIRAGVLECKIDTRYFGRETRPIFKLLQYATDPLIPGLTGNEDACIAFLVEHEVRLRENDLWRRWIDLREEEKRKILSEIVKILIRKGFGSAFAKRIIGEVYLLSREEEGTELHDAKEFATLLNATARYGEPEIGLRVCLGDREEAFKRARSMLRKHRQSLLEGLQFAREGGIIKRDFLQYFHAGEGIRDTIVGIVAGILLNSGEVDQDIPLIGFALTEDGKVKVSARGTRRLVEKGLNLSVALSKGAKAVGGVGGGHDIAAGATIPIGKEEEFLEVVEEEIKNQLLREVL